MRLSRKIAVGAAVTFGVPLLALITLPLFFGDRLADRLRAEIDRSVDARVRWGDVRLSLVRDFPNASLSLDDLSIVGIDRFAGDTLVTMRRARLALDLASVVRHLRAGERIVVREVTLDAPDARLRVLEDGSANWDILREEPAKSREASRAVGVTLRDLSIADGRVSLDDRRSRTSINVVGLHESLEGDFAEDEFVLRTRTRADTVSVALAGVPWLRRVGVEVNADVDANLPAKRYRVREGTVRLNRLALALAGTITLGATDTHLDLKFSAPGTAFREILSLVPAIYAREFDRIEASGTMAVLGQVRGRYGPAAFPALAIRVRVDDGAFRHEGMPLPARDIALQLAIDNPGGDVDRTVVTLERFHASLGGRPVDARFTLRTPISDPDLDLRLKGALDLADVAKAVRIEGVTRLAGLVDADVAMRARMSDVDAARFDRVTAAGGIRASRIALRSSALPHPVAIDTAALRLTPRSAELQAFTAKVGASDVRATGSLDNILGFLLRDEDLRGRASVVSNTFDLNEWRSDDALTVVPVPSHVDFALEASVRRVLHGPLTMENVRGDVRIRGQRATLDELRMEMLRGTVVATGWYETVVARPTFDIALRLAAVDIPSAFAAVTTVQRFAPVAKWARGAVSGTIALKGALGEDMMPLFPALTGSGSIETDHLAMKDAPILARLADALSLPQIRNPALGVVRASFDIVDGRLRVKPFATTVNGIAMTVAGSNGIDQSLLYDMALSVPRGALGTSVARVASQVGDVVQLGAKVTGTVTDPAVKPDFSGTVSALRTSAHEVVQAGVRDRTEAVEARVDSAADAARARAQAEANRVVAEAEEQAQRIRSEGAALADRVRDAARVRADSLEGRAAGPAARIAAKAAADRVRREGEEQADRVRRAADERAGSLVAAARRRADALMEAAGTRP